MGVSVTYFKGPRRARRFTEFQRAKMPRRARRHVGNKLKDRDVAVAVGIRTAQLLATYDRPEEIDLGALPDRFVLKATNMSAMRGVYLIVKHANQYYDMHSRRAYSADELITGLAKPRKKVSGKVVSPFAAAVIAEELIVGENGASQIPFDYKMYTFDGTVRLVVQIDRNVVPPAVAFFDQDFEPVDDHCIRLSEAAQRGVPRRPTNWRQLLEAAQRISLHLDVPFVSVDVYTTGDDVVLGELTGSPGGPYFGMWRFSDEFDAELGTYYKMALRRRGVAAPIVEGLPPVLQRRSLLKRLKVLADVTIRRISAALGTRQRPS